VQDGKVLDDACLAGLCVRLLGERPAAVLFRAGYLSEVAGVQLADGTAVVIKIRPAASRIVGCTAVQAHLARAGFPCPVPLAGPMAAGDDLMVTAEALIPGGSQLPAARGAAPYAGLLAWCVRSAPEPASVPSLAPAPPWTAWDHSGARLWPDTDDHGRNLNEVPGPAWVDDAAQRVRQRVNRYAAPRRIGHGDWESQNIRWSGEQPLAVHDWDSAIAQPEAAIVGLAAAVWPAGGPVSGGASHAATVAQSADFIASYQSAAGTGWSEEDVQAAWAAGLWVRLFNAKKDAAFGDFPELGRLAGEIDERLSLAAL
jgi:Phosphotransferase enzyme family